MADTSARLNPAVVDLVKRYGRAVISSGIPVQDIILFGSQVKGTAHPDSDIDVAVISPIFGQDIFAERVKLMRLGHDFLFIEPHPMHPDDLNNPWSTFSHEVKTYGVSVLPLLQKSDRATTRHRLT